MITLKATISDSIADICVDGHADFNPGNDIVCASVSVLIQSMAKALGRFSSATLEFLEWDSGKFHLIISDVDNDGDTIVASFLLGLAETAEAYPENIECDVSYDDETR